MYMVICAIPGHSRLMAWGALTTTPCTMWAAQATHCRWTLHKTGQTVLWTGMCGGGWSAGTEVLVVCGVLVSGFVSVSAVGGIGLEFYMFVSGWRQR